MSKPCISEMFFIMLLFASVSYGHPHPIDYGEPSIQGDTSNVESSSSSKLNVEQPANKNNGLMPEKYRFDRIRFGISSAFSVIFIYFANYNTGKDIDIKDVELPVMYNIGLFLNIPRYRIHSSGDGGGLTAYSLEINYTYRMLQTRPLEKIEEHLITIPILLTDQFMIEIGPQFGFPLKTVAGRKEIDYELIIGTRIIGELIGYEHFSAGIRLGLNLGGFKKRGFYHCGFSTYLLF